MSNQTPTIGRIVHYHSYGTPNGEYLPEARAAIITDVKEERVAVPNQPDGSILLSPDVYLEDRATGRYLVSLCVLNPTGLFFNQRVPFSETPKPGHWTWPPRS